MFSTYVYLKPIGIRPLGSRLDDVLSFEKLMTVL